MKLIYCTKCQDVVRLVREERHCRCGLSAGIYTEDGLNATYSGPCLPLGFDNGSFVRALNRQPESGRGERFEAFVIPKECPTFKRR